MVHSATFVDSNVLIYSVSTDARADVARELLATGVSTGVQALNEFANVCRRRLGMPWPDIVNAELLLLELATSVLPTLLDDHVQSLRLANRYQLSIYDALMLAVALRAGCKTFMSEDLHDGLLIDDQLRIINPFR